MVRICCDGTRHLSQANVNIGGSSHDTSYRYKMPKLIAKVEGRGNGIKTKIVNMVEIAKALKVPPSCKFGPAVSFW